MGIYISEINMPKGEGSKLVLQIFPNGEVYDEHGIRLGITNWAEAVHVPPHGRLIDEDVLIKTAHNQWPLPIDFLKLLELVPTVIPADGEDTDVPTRKEEV